MSTIVTRLGKGSALTWEEADANFTNLNIDKLEAGFSSSLVEYLPTGTGAVTASVQAKLRESVSVKDFGAVGDGVADDYPAFLAAVTVLPVGGGRVLVPSGTYRLDTEPTWGAKSMYWDIDPSAVFTGAGTGQEKFPYMNTNTGQMAVGPWIQSQSGEHSTNPNGGIAAMQVEMIQPSDYGAGQSVAMYLGAAGSCANVAANVWALNPLIRADAGALGTYQCIEVDVDNFAPGALVKGISINGVGTADPYVALEIIRTGAALGAAGRNWVRGIDLRDSRTGIWINPGPTLVTGIAINGPSHGAGGILVKQLDNNTDCFFAERKTDSSPLGYFYRAVNAANTVTLFSVGIDGSVTSASAITCNGITSAAPVQGLSLKITGGASSMPAGQICLGSSTSTAATAGSASALPALPSGYWTFFIGTNIVKVPYYNV